MAFDNQFKASNAVVEIFHSGRARGLGRVGVGSNPKSVLVSACLLMASADAPHSLCN